MNPAGAAALLQKLSDYQLKMEMSRPSGIAPMDMVQAEVKRRAMMRQNMPAYMPGNAMPGGVTNPQAVIGAPPQGMPPPQGYADGGVVKLAGGGPPNPYGFASGGDYDASLSSSLPGYLQAFGVQNGVQTMDQLMPQMRQYVRDPSAAYDPMIEEMQRQYQQQVAASKGRPLMEMGLAMMSAHTPNFWQALGEGGQQGLQASDRIRANEGAMMQQMMNARLAQANAQSGYDENMFRAAAGEREAQQRGLGEAYGLADRRASTMAGLQNDQAKALLETKLRNMEDATTLEAHRISAGPEYARVAMEKDRYQGVPKTFEPAYAANLKFVDSLNKNYLDKTNSQFWVKDPAGGMGHFDIDAAQRWAYDKAMSTGLGTGNPGMGGPLTASPKVGAKGGPSAADPLGIRGQGQARRDPAGVGRR